jgi:hypothetical protein
LIINGLNNEDFYAPKLFKNDNGVFVDAAIELPSTWEKIVPGDYDNDGDPDLLFLEVMPDYSPFTNIYDNVLKDGQIITFDPLPAKTYGDAAFELVATSSSTLPVNFEIISGPGILTHKTITITGAGDIIIEASQSGSVDFNPAYSIRQTLIVNKGVLVASADDKTMVYGETLPTLTSSFSGFVLGDDQTAISVAPALSTTASNVSNAGIYIIEASGGVADNYTFNYVEGALTINKAPLTIAANDQTITYGMEIPTLTYAYTGFVNGQNATVLNTEPGISTTADINSNAGSYDIILDGGSANNYELTLVNGELTIDRAMATISATNLEQIFDGSAKEASIVTDPAGLTYVATYNGDEASPIAIGSYDLEITIDDINYESHSTATFIIQLISSVEQNGSPTLTIYPMPATQTINIEGDVKNLHQTQVYDLTGQVILNQQFKKQLDISHLKSGHYILRLIDQTGLTISTQNIIIK